MNVIFFIISLLVAGINAHNIQLSQSQKDKAHQYTLQCMKESAVKPEMLSEAKKGHFNDDEALKKFTLCFFQKSGILNHDGKLDIDVALTKLPAGVDKTAFTKVLEECKNKTGKDTADSAFEIYKCYYHGTPAHVVF